MSDSKMYLIIAGIQQRLKEAGIDFDTELKEILSNEIPSSLGCPLGNISVNSSTDKRINQNTKFNRTMLISFFLTVGELDEAVNRKAILNLIDAVDDVLFHADIGIELQDRLKPAGFNNVTDKQRSDAGLMLYQLNYTCSYNFTRKETDDLGLITQIYNKYYLQDPTDDGVTDAEGEVDLSHVGGGDPASAEGKEIYGGKPDDEFTGGDIGTYGGTPASE